MSTEVCNQSPLARIAESFEAQRVANRTENHFTETFVVPVVAAIVGQIWLDFRLFVQ